MLQRKVRNERYKPFTKQWLLDQGIDVILDGVSTKDIPLRSLQLFYYDYKTLEVRQYSHKWHKWMTKAIVRNTAIHDKGILKECSYYQVSVCRRHKTTLGIPLHRIVYVWFNNVIEPYNSNNEKMEICHNKRYDDPILDSHITNLRWDTAKANRADRGGAVNQYGPRKEKYGSELIKAIVNNE